MAPWATGDTWRDRDGAHPPSCSPVGEPGGPVTKTAARSPMSSPTGPSLASFERSQIVRSAFRALATAAVLLVAYYLFPIEHRPHQSVFLRLLVALVFFAVVVVNEVRLISSHGQPTLRAGVSMATILPLFLVLFSWIYLTMSHSDPGAFGQQLTRSSALYFTVTVFSTVGFGDIVPKTDPARLVVTVQMVSDLVVLAVVVRLILGAATRGGDRLQETSA